MSVSVSLAGLPCHPHRPIKLLLAAMQIRCYFSGCWRRRPGALPHMWAAGRESDKKSEETENILMERNDKLSQSRMRHETRQGPELILTVSHQIRPRLSYVSEARTDQEVVMSTLRLLIFTELSADWACSEKAGRDFSHNEWVFLRIFCPSSRNLYTVRKASKIIFQSVGFS